jgi:hypothetical protein
MTGAAYSIYRLSLNVAHLRLTQSITTLQKFFSLLQTSVCVPQLMCCVYCLFRLGFLNLAPVGAGSESTEASSVVTIVWLPISQKNRHTRIIRFKPGPDSPISHSN